MEETRKPARKQRPAAAPKAAPKAAAKKAADAGKPAARKTATGAPKAAGPSPVEREQLVRTAAYYRAQRRGFAPGYEWDDWLAAEAEVKALVERRATPKSRKAPARKAKAG